jgi:hypothetical protein
MESNGSISTRLLWLMSGFNSAAADLIARRSSKEFGKQVNSFKNHVDRNFPSKSAAAQNVIDKLGELATAIESLLDA